MDWEEKDRVLKVSASSNPIYTPDLNIGRGIPGTVAGNAYSTDIDVFINGVPFYSYYNIGGVTCAAVEDLGVNSATDAELSVYGMRYTYNDTDRTLKLYVKR